MLVGLVLNPFAGMGGSVGLKGTDGTDILEEARRRGAEPISPSRATEALKELSSASCGWVAVEGDMGGDLLTSLGIDHTEVPIDRRGDGSDTASGCEALLDAGAGIILFCGGDGTARDVMGAVGTTVPVIGIPSGVKMHSSVFGNHPRDAGVLLRRFLENGLELREAEVMDIDEDAFREGRVSAELYGYLTVPRDPVRVQGGKAGRAQKDEHALDAIAYYLIDNMQPDRLYILGTGSTVLGIKQRLEIDGSLLGVDVTRGRKQIGKDVTEQQILELLDEEGGENATIVVTVIGGQGYIFGRGNQQLSPRVIERVGKDNIMVVATKAKIAALGGRPLLVDTGSEEVNEMLTGYTRVITGYHEQIAVRVAS